MFLWFHSKGFSKSVLRLVSQLNHRFEDVTFMGPVDWPMGCGKNTSKPGAGPTLLLAANNKANSTWETYDWVTQLTTFQLGRTRGSIRHREIASQCSVIMR